MRNLPIASQNKRVQTSYRSFCWYEVSASAQRDPLVVPPQDREAVKPSRMK